MVHDPFNVLLDLVCLYFDEDFVSMFISDNWPVNFFLVASLSSFDIRWPPRMSLGVFLPLQFFLEQFQKDQFNSLLFFCVYSVVKTLPAGAGDLDLTPVLGRSSGEGNGNPLQYSCLRNPMDRGAWWTTVYGGHRRGGHDLVTKQPQMFNTKEFTWEFILS